VIIRGNGNHDARGRHRPFPGARSENIDRYRGVVTSSSWFLLLSVLGVATTCIALRPPKWPEWVMAITFFTAWLTTELAAWYLAVQVVVTVVFVAAGALDAWPGWVGLALTLVSWCGLLWIVANARRTGRIFAAALDEGLGAGWGNTLNPDIVGTPYRLELRRLLLPFAFKRSGVERVRSIQYFEVGGDTGPRARRHRLDVYRTPESGPGAPVLLQIHGGGWVIGAKEQQGLPLMNFLATRGWVCVAINYRLSPRATWPDQLLDCKRALAWIREHIAEYGGDPDYVVVTGGSAGGHLAALMGLTPNDPAFQPGFESVDTHVRAMLPFYGVYDWTNRFGQRGHRDGLRRILERMIVKQRYADAPEVYAQASPFDHINPDAPPALIVHGTLDTLAPVGEAREFVRELRAVSHKPVVYAELPGAHHAFDVFQSIRTLQAIAAVDQFLTWTLSVDPPRALAALAAPADRSDSGAAAAGGPTGPRSTGRTAPSPSPRAS
jgi:acetyl esterase/lipase